jgi:hypothetical protein
MRRLVLPLLLVFGCAGAGTPHATARAYADALRENRLVDAYELTTQEQRQSESLQAFSERYASAERRAARADEVVAAANASHVSLGAVELAKEGDRWAVADLPPREGPREVVERFIRAVEGGDFGAAYHLLGGSWRARYTADRLRADFLSEPAARERLARAKSALSAQPTWTEAGVEFPIGEGRAVRLMREAGAFRIAALE